MRLHHAEHDPLEDDEAEARLLRDVDTGRPCPHRAQLGILVVFGLAAVMLASFMWCLD